LSELDVGLVESIKPLQTEPYGYPRWIEVNGKKIDANKFRLTVGANVIKSTAFQVDRRGTKFVFKGKGWGHGVGLCQWGAYGLAVGGKDWSEILNYYYPGAETHVAM
jgi:stage II sporulation protein D